MVDPPRLTVVLDYASAIAHHLKTDPEDLNLNSGRDPLATHEPPSSVGRYQAVRSDDHLALLMAGSSPRAALA